MHDELTADDLRFVPPKISEDCLKPFLRKFWRMAGEFKPLVGERDQNFCVTRQDGTKFVFKISSAVEDPALVDFQIRALLHLKNADPDLPIPRVVQSRHGNLLETLVDESGEAHAVRVLSFVPGVALGSFDPPSLATIEQIGALQGLVCKALSGFDHEAAPCFMPWDILNDLVISRSLRTDYLKNGLAAKCAPALERLENDSLPRMHQLPGQVIHNDSHSGNVLCDPSDPSRITGLIDFGDLVKRPLLVDLSTSLASIIERSTAPLAASAALLRGFDQHTPIPVQQLELLYDATLARAILAVQLLEFQAANTDADAAVCDEYLPVAKIGLLKILDIDPVEFLDCIHPPEQISACSGQEQ